MEILAERLLWGEYYVLIVFLAIVAVVAVIGLIATIISWRSYDVFTNVVVTLLVSVLLVAPVIGITKVYSEGPTVYYDAIVTDYNEVYDAGYMIVSTEGKIVTLTKEDAK